MGEQSRSIPIIGTTPAAESDTRRGKAHGSSVTSGLMF
jgi:hypothetical protein